MDSDSEPTVKRLKLIPELENVATDEDKKNEEIDNDHHLYPFPPDNDINEMLKGIELNIPLPTVTDRYFTPYFKIDLLKPKDDICIRIHSNRICMLSLAPSHELLENDNIINQVSFKVSNKLDRASNKVSGKGKHGAQPLQSHSNICTVLSSTGKNYIIKCCMTGKLVEVNESLITNPQLLKEPPHKGGYLAIVLPNLRLLEEIKRSLLTQEQYDIEMWKRANPGVTIDDI